ncbi:hypothetical protein SGRI78S_02672 [Streptomyces griseus subsp. griseus]
MRVLRQFRFISKAEGEAATTAARHAPCPEDSRPPPRASPTARAASASVDPVVNRSSTRITRPSRRCPCPGAPRRRSRPPAAVSLQGAGQIRPSLPRPETGLVGDRAPLPQQRERLRRQPLAAQVPGSRRGDPAHRVVAARRRRGARGGHRDQQQGPRPARPPRTGPHRPRQGPPEDPGQPQCPSLLVGQQNRAYGVLVRRGRVHRWEPRGPGRGPHRAGLRTVQRGPAGRAQLGARPAAAGAGHRQEQTGPLLPRLPHGPTVPGPPEPDHPCGQPRASGGPGPLPDQPG